MAIEEREQMAANDAQIDLPDFQAEEQTPKRNALLDLQDRDANFKSFATPEHTQARSTQMNTPEIVLKQQQRRAPPTNQSPDIKVIQVSPQKGKARVAKAKVKFQKVNRSGIANKQHG